MASTNAEAAPEVFRIHIKCSRDDAIDTMSFRERRLRKRNEQKAADGEDNDETNTGEGREDQVGEMKICKMSLNPNVEIKDFENEYVEDTNTNAAMDKEMIQGLLAEQEEQLRKEFAQTLQNETEALKTRFDYILQNEQIRASHMLQEAHRERKEKITALKHQLQCKNLAALMYLMCVERTKCKMEKFQLIETYTNYINMLNEVLAEGQELILHLSRGYKTAARIDFEWKQKMNQIINQFLRYIYHYSGTPPEQNQFYFDLPALLSSVSPTVDDPNEDPIQEEDPDPRELSDLPEYKTWWERLNDECRPFVVYGDMAAFAPNERRETLKTVKAAKTAPKKWKEYAFNEMFLNSECLVADLVKDQYLSRLPEAFDRWECQGLHSTADFDMNSRRQTVASVDFRGNMGSILKIITATTGGDPVTKANLLGARDSIEIASTTKLRCRKSESEKGRKDFKVGRKKTAQMYDDLYPAKKQSTPAAYTTPYKPSVANAWPPPEYSADDMPPNEMHFGRKMTTTGHRDSLEMIPNHVPDPDHKINFEKVCPMPKCQRMHVDSFMRSLPNYMRANPFTHFEQTFEEYELCTPEQMELLQKRVDEKKQQHREEKKNTVPVPWVEWQESVEGIAVQTSNFEMDDLPPCTCRDPNPSLVSIHRPGASFDIKDLLPAKLCIDEVARDCIWNDEIEFNRFKVIGEDKDSAEKDAKKSLHKLNAQFTRSRLQEIKSILKKNPSLLDLFQANTV